MSIEDTHEVDIVSKDQQGRILLTISDHLDWKDPTTHLELLQDKVQTYLQFIRSGELTHKFPDATGRHVVIQVMFHYPWHPSSVRILSDLKLLVESEGCGFRYELFSATPFKA